MIERMKKITVLAKASARESALDSLRQLGILHLQPFQKTTNPDVERLRKQLDQLTLAWNHLPADIRQNLPMEKKTDSAERGLNVAEDLLHSQQSLEAIQGVLDDLYRQLSELKPIRRIDANQIRELREAGVFVRFYLCDAKEYEKLGSKQGIWRIATIGNIIYLALISRDSNPVLPLRELILPPGGIEGIEQRIAELENQRKQTEQCLSASKDQAPCIQSAWLQCQNRLEFEQARAGMGSSQEVAFLQGFCPVSRLSDLNAAARHNAWSLWIDEPAEDDPVPTLLRQSRFTALFQPVMKFLGVMPGYRELDTNGLFLIFFTLFFAMIVGDAGYGLLMLIGTFLFSRMRLRFTSQVRNLFYILSAGTIVWGAISGVWFGIRQVAELPVLRSLVVPGLDAFSGDYRNIIRLCLMIGAIHLTVAHVWRAILYLSPRSLLEIGWTLIVWGLFFIAVWLLLNEKHPRVIVLCMSLGSAGLVLFGEHSADGGFLRNLGRSIIKLPLTLLNVIGGFSDVVSYIRLFAVGLATLEVATAFNQMAAAIGVDSIPAAIGVSIILLFGHGLNLVLVALGVIVHGVRLNLLEFSKHVDVGWSGIPYRPFQRITTVQSIHQTKASL